MQQELNWKLLEEPISKLDQFRLREFIDAWGASLLIFFARGKQHEALRILEMARSYLSQ